ncbi:FAD-dependent monooxygenase [Streptomyces wuyuanensis]|uniref:FAD-dependent monooxygenase n=1 Tax=Streptomyces wuyuanensis TaxID=1196353 RepID=UPI003440B2E5
MELNSVKETDRALGASVDVLVVGAGPTGLALAVDLTRRGVGVLVAEKADALFPGSRGKGLQPRTMEVLDDLGAVDAVLAAGGPAPLAAVWEDGRRTGAYDMFDRTPPSGAEPYSEPWLLPQWRTQEILLARLRELGGDVAFGSELTALSQDAGGVTAELANRRAPSAGRPRPATRAVVRARYAVAADGGRSTVRTALGIALHGDSVDPAPMLVADVRVPDLDRDNWHMFGGGKAGLLALCPLPGTEHFQLVARYAQGAPDISPEGVRSAVAARSHLRADQVTEVRWASDFRPRAALAERFRAGRVLLAGDAAHVHSPAGGQGLNTGVQDAYNLGWKLGQVLRHGAPEALLDTYEQERRPVAARMLDLSTRIHRGAARRGHETRQLGLGYRGGPLSEGAAGALEAGDRAPDGRLPGGRRVFDLLRGPHFTLLAVDRDAPGTRLPAAVHVHRTGAGGGPGTAGVHASYGSGLFLVRPDGYVGWAGQDPAGLADWLGKVMRC